MRTLLYILHQRSPFGIYASMPFEGKSVVVYETSQDVVRSVLHSGEIPLS